MALSCSGDPADNTLSGFARGRGLVMPGRRGVAMSSDAFCSSSYN